MKFLALAFFWLTVFAKTTAVAAAMTSETVPPDNGFDPGPFFVALLFCAVLIVLIGVGIVIGMACLACTAIFIALGIISSSALLAILKRRFSAGLRALHYQLFVLLSFPCGIGFLWLGCLLFHLHIRHRYIFGVGSAIGIVAGVIMAFILDRFLQFVYRRLTLASRFQASA